MDGLSDRGSIPLSSTWRFYRKLPRLYRGFISLFRQEVIMKKLWLCIAFVLMFLLTGCGKFGIISATPTPGNPEGTIVVDKTKTEQFKTPSKGDTMAEITVKDFGMITVRLFPNVAPKAVENFVTHAKEGYYDNTKFHRVIADFMIQGGDPEGTGFGGKSIYGNPFEDEFADSFEPFRGALCMANSGKNTNGSQFFIVQGDADYVRELEELIQYKGYTLAQYCKSAYDTTLSELQVAQFREFGGAPWLSKHHTVFGQVIEGLDVLDKIAAVETNAKDVPVTDVIVTSVRIYSYGE